MKSLKKIWHKINDLIAKYEFWRASKLKLEDDWQFMYDVSNPKAFTIRIRNKRWEGVIVEYSDLMMSDTEGRMNFNLEVLANPNLKETDSKAFKKFTTDIIRSILVDSLKRAEELLNENGTPNLVEPLEERTVHEEDDSVFEERVPERKPRKKTVRRNSGIRK